MPERLALTNLETVSLRVFTERQLPLFMDHGRRSDGVEPALSATQVRFPFTQVESQDRDNG